MARFAQDRRRFTKKTLDDLLLPPYPPHKKRFYDLETGALGVRFSRLTISLTFIAKVQDAITGKWIYPKIGSYPDMTIEDARQKALEYYNRAVSGALGSRVGDMEKVTLALLLDRYIRDRTTGDKPLRPRTVQWLRYSIEHYLPEWLPKPLSAITPDKVDAKYRDLVSNGVAPTAHGVFRGLRALFNYGMEIYRHENGRPFITENPVNVLSKRRVWSPPAPKERVLTPGEIQFLWKELTFRRRKASATPNDPHQKSLRSMVPEILILFLFTGARRNDIITLQKYQVDLNRRALLFDKTKNRDRSIPIPDCLFEYLAARVATCKTENDWLYPNPGNSTGHITEYKTTISFLVNNSEKALAHFSAHDLRRTFITYGSSVCPGDYIQIIVGHKLTTVTGRHYFKPDLDELRPHMNNIAKRLLTLARQGNTSPTQPSVH